MVNIELILTSLNACIHILYIYTHTHTHRYIMYIMYFLRHSFSIKTFSKDHELDRRLMCGRAACSKMRLLWYTRRGCTLDSRGVRFLKLRYVLSPNDIYSDPAKLSNNLTFFGWHGARLWAWRFRCVSGAVGIPADVVVEFALYHNNYANCWVRGVTGSLHNRRVRSLSNSSTWRVLVSCLRPRVFGTLDEESGWPAGRGKKGLTWTTREWSNRVQCAAIQGASVHFLGGLWFSFGQLVADWNDFTTL